MPKINIHLLTFLAALLLIMFYPALSVSADEPETRHAAAIAQMEKDLAGKKLPNQPYYDTPFGQELVTATTRFLQLSPHPLTDETAEMLVTTLKRLLPSGDIPADCGYCRSVKPTPWAKLYDLDHDGLLDVVMQLPKQVIIPADGVVVFLSHANYGVQPIALGYVLDGNITVQSFDVTGDRQAELIMHTQGVVGLGPNETNRLYEWDETAQRFNLIFNYDTDSGEFYHTYIRSRQAKDGSIVYQLVWTSGDWFSTNIKERTRTETWQWDGQAHLFTKGEMQETDLFHCAPFDEAEVLARRLDSLYRPPIWAYEKVLTQTQLAKKGDCYGEDTDWAAAAHLRLGQSYALWGKTREARHEFEQVKLAGGAWAKVATAFLAQYDGLESLESAWRTMIFTSQAITRSEGLMTQIVQDSFFNPAQVIATYLNQPITATMPLTDQLTLALTRLHLTTTNRLVTDFDNNGSPDIVLSFNLDMPGYSTVRPEQIWGIFQPSTNTWQPIQLLTVIGSTSINVEMNEENENIMVFNITEYDKKNRQIAYHWNGLKDVMERYPLTPSFQLRVLSDSWAQLGLGYRGEQAMPLLADSLQNNTRHIFTDEQIEGYDWHNQIITLTVKASKEFKSFHLQPFVASYGGAWLYAGVFLAEGSTLPMDYPVILYHENAGRMVLQLKPRNDGKSDEAGMAAVIKDSKVFDLFQLQGKLVQP